jgi:hypothetical protein
MSKISVVVESLKTTYYLIAAAAVAGTVMMPIPPVRAADVGMQTTAVSLPSTKPIRTKTSVHAPLDLAGVARMAPPDIVAKAKELAASDTIGIVTKQQIIEYAKSNPGFVAKLQHAYLTGSEPKLTAEEGRILQAFSDAALGNMKAGDANNTFGSGPPTSTFSPFGLTGPQSENEAAKGALIAVAAVALILLLLYVWALSTPPNCHVVPGTATPADFGCNLRLRFGLPVYLIP